MTRFQELGLVLVILLLGSVLSVYGWHDARAGRPNTFLNFDNQVGGIATPMSYYAIMALGMTFIVITGGIDISVGAMMALTALGSAAVLQTLPQDAPAWQVMPVAIGVPLAIGLLCGLLNGVLIVGLRLHPFIVTLGTMSIFRGLANVLPWFSQKTLPTGGRYLPDAFTTNFMRLPVSGLVVLVWLAWLAVILLALWFLVRSQNKTPAITAMIVAALATVCPVIVTMKVGYWESLVGGTWRPVQPMPMIVMLLCVAIAWIYLRLTIPGREVYAIGGNEEAARFSGIRVNRVKLRVYAIGGLTCGIAGMVSLGRFGTASTSSGTGYELTVIAAAVVGGASLTGGRGSALGALLGTLIIAMIENAIIILHLVQEYRLIIIGIAIVLAAALDRFSDALRQRRLARAKIK